MLCVVRAAYSSELSRAKGRALICLATSLLLWGSRCPYLGGINMCYFHESQSISSTFTGRHVCTTFCITVIYHYGKGRLW